LPQKSFTEPPTASERIHGGLTADCFGPLALETTMRFHKTFTVGFGILLIILYFVTNASAQDGLKTPEPDPTIRSLLNEVRLLRQTLQTTGLNAYRSQILLERIK
jgi:hypothetical protein